MSEAVAVGIQQSSACFATSSSRLSLSSFPEACPSTCSCRHVLHGAMFAFSGFHLSSRPYMKQLCRKIRLMGGKISKFVDTRTTHVLVEALGIRAKEAALLRINCFEAAYVDRCWEERHTENFMDVEESFVRSFLVRPRKLGRTASIRAPAVTDASLSAMRVRRSLSKCATPTRVLASSASVPPLLTVVDDAKAAATKKMLQQRKHLITELLQTEKTYLVLLEFIAKHYVTPLQEQASQRISPLKTDYSCAVFGPWKDLYSLHRSLLGSLQESVDYSCAALSEPSVVPSIGGSFLTHINAFDRLYPEYIKTFDDRKEYLNQAMKADSMFRTFIQTRRKLTTSLTQSSECSSLKKLALHDMLIGPVQRLTRYTLLLKGILAHTPDSHTDRVDIANALVAIKATNERSNLLKMASEGEARLAGLSAEVDGFPAASSSERRWLVSEADVIMLDDKHMPGYRCDLPVKLMVLSDSIQIALVTFTNRRKHLTHYISIPYSSVLWMCRYVQGKDTKGLPDIGIQFLDPKDGVSKLVLMSCASNATTSVTILLTNISRAAKESVGTEKSTLLTNSILTLPAWAHLEPIVPEECRERTPLGQITSAMRNSDVHATRSLPKRVSKTEAMLRLATPTRRSRAPGTPTKPATASQDCNSTMSRLSSLASSVTSRKILSRTKTYKPSEPLPYEPHPSAGLRRRPSLMTAIQSGNKVPNPTLKRNKSRTSLFSRTNSTGSRKADRSLIAKSIPASSLPNDLSDAGGPSAKLGPNASLPRRRSMKLIFSDIAGRSGSGDQVSRKKTTPSPGDSSILSSHSRTLGSSSSSLNRSVQRGHTKTRPSTAV